MLTLEQGNKLIKLARQSIESRFSEKEFSVNESIKQEFKYERGCFVTLTIGGELRGCIGFSEPVFPLWEAIVRAAESAAFGDPRFTPLSKEEYQKINVEVSVLTLPKLIEVKNSDEYLETIKIGRDGLIAEMGGLKGLLLPQVAPEWKWNVEEFLNYTCQKAGLPPSAWKDDNCKIYSFSAQIFSEEKGKVVEKKHEKN